ncbi:MAG: hypothetical protein AB8V10_08140 [Francisella endosymbiont of Hyalomma asiaticum]
MKILMSTLEKMVGTIKGLHLDSYKAIKGSNGY